MYTTNSLINITSAQNKRLKRIATKAKNSNTTSNHPHVPEKKHSPKKSPS